MTKKTNTKKPKQETEAPAVDGCRILQVLEKSKRGMLVKLETVNESGGMDTQTIKSAECAEPELHEALQKLQHEMLKTCELEGESAKGVEVTGISLITKGDMDHVVIFALKHLKTGKGSVDLKTTPLLVSKTSKEGLAKAACDHLEEIYRLAVRFIDGHRAQQGLNLNGETPGT